MKVFATAAVLRKGSFNRKLINLAADIMRDDGHEVDLADFAEFDMPFFNGDIEETPDGARELSRRISEADACVISIPEYNYSLPAAHNAR